MKSREFTLSPSSKTFAAIGMGAIALLAQACGGNSSPDEAGADVQGVNSSVNAKITPMNESEMSSYSFGASTPLGREVFRYGVGWNRFLFKDGLPRPSVSSYTGFFAQAAKCAANLSEVFEEVFGSKYTAPAVGDMLDKLRSGGSYQVKFRGDSSASIVSKLNGMHAGLKQSATIRNTGYLPIGTVIAGCTVGKNCVGGGPDEHIGMVGNAKVRPGSAAGTTVVSYYAWNNNWLRKLSTSERARDLGNGLGKVGAFTLPANFASKGFERRWEGVPWLEVTYDASGKAIAAKRLLPEMDDLDLGNGGYDTYLVVPGEIKNELNANTGVQLLKPAAAPTPKPTPAPVAHAGMASIKNATFLKKRPVSSSDLADDEKCSVTDLTTVLTYTDHATAEGGHVKIVLKEADRSCPNLTGTVYLFGAHWNLTDAK